ncbi:MAG TPA: hypothetical protein DCM05_16325 [Elusimicrobia bacterium]|nr:hypothetical protein [Elusimicrobiota bacterium]
MTGGEKKDFADFIAALNAQGVEYVIVGGYAVVFHGHVRFTKDIDILVRPTPRNAKRLMSALKGFGFGGLGLKESDVRPGNIIQLGRPPNRIDLLMSIDGVDADAAWDERVMGSFLGQTAGFLSKERLIENKKATGRTQDRADAEALERE